MGIELENLHHIIIEECYERRFVASSGEFIKYLDLKVSWFSVKWRRDVLR